MPASTKDAVISYIATFFSRPESDILETTVAEDIEGWDSMANAEIIMGLEEELGVELEVEDLLELDNVGCMVSIFEKRLKAA